MLWICPPKNLLLLLLHFLQFREQVMYNCCRSESLWLGASAEWYCHSEAWVRQVHAYYLNKLGSCCVLNIFILMKSTLPSNSENGIFCFQVSPFSMNKPYERDLDRFGSSTMQGRQSTSVHTHPYLSLVTLWSPAHSLHVFIVRASGGLALTTIICFLLALSFVVWLWTC
jgi:hypothetical protein